MSRTENLNLPPYSVLMSVYEKENPEFLFKSLESTFIQSYPADEVILVCDGKLGEDLDNVVRSFEEMFPDRFKVIRLPENKGTAFSANAGLEAARNEYIMKMDSDDICYPSRAEKQMTYMAQHPDVTIVGAFIEEFLSDTGEIIAVRKTPVENEEIRKFAKRRAPFNNQSIVYKKSAAMKIGGYCNDLVRCEDYDFMVRLLADNQKAANIPEVLIKYRVNKDNLNRRRNWSNTKSFIKVRRKIYKMGYSGFFDFLIPCTTQLILFIMPTFVTRFVYNKMLRK